MNGVAHNPVMLTAAIEGLAVEPDGFYLDCTFGRGGHSQAILQRMNATGKLLAIDKDATAVTEARTLLDDSRFKIEHSSFSNLYQLVEQCEWMGKVSGVLMDLGVSSPQLDVAERGFSFLREGALDMRMNTATGETAADWLAKAVETDIVRVLKVYGEERFARRIARSIVQSRVLNPIVTTGQLARLVQQAIPVPDRHKHPATRTFQAIRIHINQELDELEQGLAQVVQVLKPGGRLVVIAFHSLEDRIVKRFIRKEARGGVIPKSLPMAAPAFEPRLKRIGKAQRASEDEVTQNPRARSAILRVAQRLG